MVPSGSQRNTGHGLKKPFKIKSLAVLFSCNRGLVFSTGSCIMVPVELIRKQNDVEI